MPLKTVSAEPPEGAGAGAGNVSPTLTFVGWYVLVNNVALVMGMAAASSSVRVTPVTGWPLPTSDMMRAFCPPGPTSRMSMSEGKLWVKPLSLTVTFKMLPLWPATTISEE